MSSITGTSYDRWMEPTGGFSQTQQRSPEELFKARISFLERGVKRWGKENVGWQLELDIVKKLQELYLKAKSGNLTGNLGKLYNMSPARLEKILYSCLRQVTCENPQSNTQTVYADREALLKMLSSQNQAEAEAALGVIVDPVFSKIAYGEKKKHELIEKANSQSAKPLLPPEPTNLPPVVAAAPKIKETEISVDKEGKISFNVTGYQPTSDAETNVQVVFTPKAAEGTVVILDGKISKDGKVAVDTRNQLSVAQYSVLVENTSHEDIVKGSLNIAAAKAEEVKQAPPPEVKSAPQAAIAKAEISDATLTLTGTNFGEMGTISIKGADVTSAVTTWASDKITIDIKKVASKPAKDESVEVKITPKGGKEVVFPGVKVAEIVPPPTAQATPTILVLQSNNVLTISYNIKSLEIVFGNKSAQPFIQTAGSTKSNLEELARKKVPIDPQKFVLDGNMIIYKLDENNSIPILLTPNARFNHSLKETPKDEQLKLLKEFFLEKGAEAK